jgi:hypothetical protein
MIALMTLRMSTLSQVHHLTATDTAQPETCSWNFSTLVPLTVKNGFHWFICQENGGGFWRNITRVQSKAIWD